ncbi:MAG: ferredoxin/flavodoxin---NADP+ reductase [Thermomicrobiales bacterium]|nr:ferredoxin/flavodoxin---NADP+ reductase [Thermomicrobiales bacterium]MEA2531848.1 ferredoxin/flavodoxin---NADP+ reductase [Thermomicrobiales bacterium]MEA2595518.1 ferredoxin/flavodoxin---NADP+ reductase [Thermomicrobiales bacterium]
MSNATTISPNGTEPDSDIYDMTIIGAGPTGLFAAFYAGMRRARTQIIDSLEEPGGALTAIYPEKYIYDVAGFPKVLAKDFVEQMVIQSMRDQPTVRLNEEVLGLERLPDGIIKLTTSRGERFSKTVIVCAGVGAFEPKRLDAPGVKELEGRGVHYFAKRVEDFRDKDVVIVGGGDSAVDWAVTLEPIARHVTLIHRSKFRAHEATVKELEESRVELRYPGCEVIEAHAGEDGRLYAVTYKNAEQEQFRIPADELIVAIGFVADLGPLKTWGFELQRNQIIVDKITMETNIPGVFAAGDICWYPAKFKLIATGAAEAVTAVNHAVTFIDPKARLDPGHSTNIMAART